MRVGVKSVGVEVGRTRFLVEVLGGDSVLGRTNMIDLCKRVAAAVERELDPAPKWRTWYDSSKRLAPLGVTVEIRDKSTKRVMQWMFCKNPISRPPFSVKSWRFMTEQDALMCPPRGIGFYQAGETRAFSGGRVAAPQNMPKPLSNAEAVMPLDPLRWRRFTEQVRPLGIDVTEFLNCWRFVNRIDGIAYDHVQAAKR